MDTVRLGGLLDGEPQVVAAGTPVLAEALQQQAVPVEQVDWRPPPEEAVEALNAVLGDPRHAAANATAVERMVAARPHLVDVRPASEALGLEKGTFLHAGPPLEWERASGPMRGALIGAMLLEGLASSPEEAERALESGAATLDSCHHHGAVGPMAGVVSPSMPVFVVEDDRGGRVRRSYCSLNEGLGKVLRYGAYGPEVIERLRWMGAVLGPVLRDAVRRHGPVDLTAITAQALQMGDELHNRNRAATSLLVRELAADIVAADAPASDLAEALRFVNGNDHFYLNLAMAAAKVGADAARGVPGSSMVVAMARNGTDFGIQVSGTGDRWFTGPAQVPDGLFLGSYGPQDANPDIGDSTIMETVGLGGFAMAAAPAIVRFVGGEVPDALAATRRMYEITLAEHPVFQVPILSFRGTPAGIDVTRVVRTGILPVINTGMAGRVAGTGQVGAGLVSPPAEVFGAALKALAALAG
ncbi:DUF1116 domain-containing protein [Thermomonospora catenispora]|uniref:DUF1116 domain-containing protein n=1 Tax=Thermomonospora catenispora TaxID=2493090 RepID=UPI00111F99CF|nr:DUF1116 domain-containing protein [Thermomonospora catenispora]TNY34476.1 DUF1116 domain-containing protein [Thermomonospora catenispora]